MKDLFDVNDGSRPSALELARQATGEAPRVESEALAAFEEKLATARKSLPDFDYQVLRAASHRVVEETAEVPRAARRPWWRQWFVAPAMVAALGVLLVLPSSIVDSPGVRDKGGQTDLGYYLWRSGRVLPGIPNQPLKAGDRVQFTYRADHHDTMVLIGVDGDGVTTVFYPEDGDEPVRVLPTGRRVLEGSIKLDDAPGPESFVAVFGPGSVEAAMELVSQTYETGGHEALHALAEEDPAVSVLMVRKK